MAKNYNDTTRVTRQLYLEKNEPQDIRLTIDSLANTDDIRYPYIGMEFYSASEDSYYRVQSLKDGYSLPSGNIVSTQPSGTPGVDFVVVPNVFADAYEERITNQDLSNLVEKEEGKGLSANDFTDPLKEKLENLEEGGGGVEIEDSVDIRLEENQLFYNDVAKAATNTYGYIHLRKTSDLTTADFPAFHIIEITDNVTTGGILQLENVVLKFRGGQLSSSGGGSIFIGENVFIDSPPVQIFGSLEINTTPFDGAERFLKTVNGEAYAEWFGAKSYPIDIDGGLFVKLSNIYGTLFNNETPINRTLDSFGYANLLSGAYPFYNLSLTVSNNRTLYLDKNTVLYPLFSSPESYYTVAANSYIPTNNMSTAIRMSPQGKILGGGYLTLIECTRTIGILVQGQSFGLMDMSYRPEVHINIMGGVRGAYGIDPTDLTGSGVPASGLGVNGNYYVNLSNYDYFTKEDGAWTLLGTANSGFNTSIRCIASGNDYRLINMNMHINDQYGFRGIEIITENGGWINSSDWKGSVSNKCHSFIHIQGTGAHAYHDMSGVCMQVDFTMAANCRLVYSGASQLSQFGIPYDLEVLSFIKNPIKFQFTGGAIANRFPKNTQIPSQHIQNDGVNNTFGFDSPVTSWVGTVAEYDALPIKNNQTVYFIEEA